MFRTRKGSQARATLLCVMVSLLCAIPMYPARVQAAVTSIAVTTTFDTVDGDTTSFTGLSGNPGADTHVSLREALLAAESTPPGPQLTITFALTTQDLGYDYVCKCAWRIELNAAPRPLLPALTRGNLTIDGSSMIDPSNPKNPTGQPTVIIDGFEVVEDVGESNGFVIQSANNTLRGLALINFYDSAVVLDGPQTLDNQIVGNLIGESLLGKPSLPGFYGIAVSNGAGHNQIGGLTDADRNLIVGNLGAGVQLSGAETHENHVLGNQIGLGIQGKIFKNEVGISIRDGAHHNVIGSAVRGNLVSGNVQGMYIHNSSENRVIGNIIGLAADGLTPMPNQGGGIFITGAASNNQIGGSAAGERNIIAANGDTQIAEGGQGIYIADQGSDGNIVQGNYIGVAADGATPRGNLRQGILVAYQASNNQIGGVGAGEGNVIDYNGLGGIRLDSDQNTVAGNLIGVAADGLTPLGNQFHGIRVGGNKNMIGPGNLIANNQIAGVVISGQDVTIQGNRLTKNATAGICVTGQQTRIISNEITANGSNGLLTDECMIRSGVFITGTQTLAQGNVILNNEASGVVVSQGNGNRLVANSISNNLISGILLQNGGNAAITAPQISSITRHEVRGISCAACSIEVFADDGDQGRDLLGMVVAGDDGSFQLRFTSVPIRTNITATNTDAAGNTSSFAIPMLLPLSDPIYLPLVTNP